MIKIDSDKNNLPIGPYSPGILFGDLIFLSGQIGLNKDNILEVGLEEQCLQIFKNIDNLLENVHSSKDKIVKTEIYLTDINDFLKINDLYSEYLKDILIFPARTTLEVSKLPKNALVEIAVMAHK
jgi:2-iminobutanoate/2-iminopropanoate deaminase